MRALLATVALLSSVALAADPGPAVNARRTALHVAVDGKLDDPAWQDAAPYTAFTENFPQFGAQPDLKTEARVLYDDTFLYVGITCFDPHPELIDRNLGRRDSAPTADQVEVAIDSSADRKTAYDFIVSAAGGLRDRMLFADINSTDTWDAVWDGQAVISSDGWSAELAIPLRALRYSTTDGAWGIEIRRSVPRTHQTFDSTPIPREANPVASGGLVVSRFGRLEGIAGLKPARDLELTPYLAARGVVRPQYSDPSVPAPRLFDPGFDLGLDFKLALTSKLSLQAAVNPDFGQVEADRVIQNLSTAEAWFPEKRPFFLQGLDLFQPVGAEYGSPQQLFYSRRIGLEAPILGAVKLTGTLVGNLDVGLLDAVVLGVGNPATAPIAYGSPDAATVARFEASPDRRWQYHPQTPLHLGPNDALPFARPQPSNYLAAVARLRFLENSSVGLVFTAATPLGPRCFREEFATEDEYRAASCQGRGANALAADWNLRTESGEWGVLGQAAATQQVGGDPAGRVLADGTVMKPGDFGFGGFVRAGKLGGEPFRFDVSYTYENEKFDLNAMGYQPLTNYQWADLVGRFVKPSGLGPFRSFSADAWLDVNYTTDGKWLGRGLNASVGGEVQFPSYDWAGARLGYEMPQFDTREISEAAVPFERLPDLFLSLWGSTDGARKLSVGGDVFGYRLFGAGAQPGSWGWGTDGWLTWRPTDRLETNLSMSYAHRNLGARYVDTLGDTGVFGAQTAGFLSVTLRQQLVITPTLTLQVYAQLFSDAVRYGPFYGAPLDAGPVHAGDVTPLVYAGTPDAHGSVLNLNAVLRWEYRLGSTLFLVYSHSQQEYVPANGPVAASEFPVRLFEGPATDTFLVKWQYWWAV